MGGNKVCVTKGSSQFVFWGADLFLWRFPKFFDIFLKSGSRGIGL